MADGGKFEFSYFRGLRNVIHENQISDPRRMLTSFLFGRSGYNQTRPRLSAHSDAPSAITPVLGVLWRLEAGLLCVCKMRNCGRLSDALVSPN